MQYLDCIYLSQTLLPFQMLKGFKRMEHLCAVSEQYLDHSTLTVLFKELEIKSTRLLDTNIDYTHRFGFNFECYFTLLGYVYLHENCITNCTYPIEVHRLTQFSGAFE